MSMKLTVTISKKLGLPDYGSVGAACGVDVELPGSLVFDDQQAFQRHARNAYAACAQAVNDELARQRQVDAGASGNGNGQGARQRPERTTTQPTTGNTNGSHRASSKQMEYVGRLIDQIPGMDPQRLDALSEKIFGKPAAELTSFEASELIDTLKSVKAGEMDLDKILAGAAT